MKPKQQPGTLSWCKTCLGVDMVDSIPVAVRATRTRSGVNCTRIDLNDAATGGASAGSTVMVAGCLSERESFSRWLSAPFRSAHKADQVLPSILDIQLPFPLEDCTYLFLPGVVEGGKTRSLAVAARSSELRKKLDAYKQAGIDPVTLDQEGIALWTQSLLETPLAEKATRVVLSLHDNYATVVIGTAESFAGAHSTRLSADHLLRILRTRLETAPQHLEWAWAGPAATHETVGPLIAVLQREWQGTSFIHNDPATFLARAIATRALAAGLMRCNLLIGEFEPPAVSARRQAFHLKTALIVLCAGLMLAFAGLATAIMSEHKLNTTQIEYYAQINRLAGYRVTDRGEKALEKARKAVKERSKVSRSFDEVFEPSLVDTLNTILVIGKENGLAYETLLLRKDTVAITGTCASWNQCEKLSQHLKKLGYSVRPDRRETSEGRILFSILPGGPGDKA